MTSTTTSTSTSPRTPNGRRTVRSLAMTAAAATAATVAVAGLGLGPTAAQADPGDTFLPIGSSQLVQSEDLEAIQIGLDTETVVLNRDDSFSPCLGEGNPWTAVLPGSPRPVRGTWTSRRHDDQALYESIAQAKSEAKAKRYSRTLIKDGIRGCQGGKSPWDFHYGPTESSGVGSGYAIWALSYTGTSTTADGGVVVIRKGSNFGIVSVSGVWGPPDAMMESVAKVAVDRLEYSS